MTLAWFVLPWLIGLAGCEFSRMSEAEQRAWVAANSGDLTALPVAQRMTDTRHRSEEAFREMNERLDADRDYRAFVQEKEAREAREAHVARMAGPARAWNAEVVAALAATPEPEAAVTSALRHLEGVWFRDDGFPRDRAVLASIIHVLDDQTIERRIWGGFSGISTRITYRPLGEGRFEVATVGGEKPIRESPVVIVVGADGWRKESIGNYRGEQRRYVERYRRRTFEFVPFDPAKRRR